MNSKKFSSNLSLPMIQENLKRFWIGSLLAFLGYFFLGTLPILFSQAYNGIADVYMVHDILRGTWPLYMIILFLVPPVAALLIYKYMQQQSSTAIMNALPFSRRMLFHSNFLSGAILCIAPIILNAIILLLVSEPTMMITEYLEDGTQVSIDVFTGANIFRWAMLYSIITLFLYAVSMFAATITGSSLIQFLLSFGFVFVGPAILLCLNTFNELYLYGYQTPELFESLLKWTCPAMGFAMDEITYKLMLWYFACFLAIYLVTYLLYQRRKMEKATDTIAFNFIKPIFKYLITFFGMSLMGFMFHAFGDENLLFVGALVGALLGYVISDMIVQKSIRIKGFAKGFGIYVVLAVLFFGAYFTDIMGYESRLPNQENVVSVYTNFSGITGRGYFSSREIKDPETIREIIAFHGDVTKTADQETIFRDSPERSYSMNLRYNLENGKEMARNYYIPFSFYSSNEHLAKAFETEGFKKSLHPILEESSEKVSSTVLYPSENNAAFGADSIALTKEESKEFITLFKKDLLEETFEEQMQYLAPVCRFEMRILTLNKNSFEVYGDQGYNTEEYNIMPYDDNVIGWLKEKGYYNRVALDPEDITTAEVYVHSSSKIESAEMESMETMGSAENVVYDADTKYQTYNGEYDGDIFLGILTDPAQIQQVLDTGQQDSINYRECYYVVFYSDNVEDGYAKDYAIRRYYDVNRVPDFIKNM